MAQLTPDGEPFSVELLDEHTATPVVRIVGDIDISTVHRVRPVIDAVASGGKQVLVFDLAHVGFMDSSCLAVLLEAFHKVGSVSIRNPSRAARRLIETTGLTGVLRCEP